MNVKIALKVSYNMLNMHIINKGRSKEWNYLCDYANKSQMNDEFNVEIKNFLTPTEELVCCFHLCKSNFYRRRLNIITTKDCQKYKDKE